jgi:hypothetical protein
VALIVGVWLFLKQSPNNSSLLEIRPSTIASGGNGVFLTRDVKMWDILDVSCIQVVSKDSIRGTPTENYTFDGSLFGPGMSILPSGFIQYINHSDQPNCIQSTRVEEREMLVRALIDMPRGTELLINYGEGWWKSRSNN